MGFTKPAYWKQSPPPSTGDMNEERYRNQIAVLELVGAQAPETLSILDGSISPTRAAVIVDTEGGAPADDLTAISTTLSDGTTLHEGMELAIRAKDASRVITVKNSAAVNGILTADGKNVVLSTGWWLVLYLENGSWRQKNVSAPMEIATENNLGLVKIGDGISVTDDGIISVLSVTIPIGGIIAFSGTFGGTGNRFPIPLGGTTPDTNWVLCDGTRTNGLAVPDIRNRMILGAGSKHSAGSTGGSETHTHSLSGTVGATTLSGNQMPSHSHAYIGAQGLYPSVDGIISGGTGNIGTGYLQNSGGSQSHTHNLAASIGTANNLPPYYTLAYIIRIA